jgi:hypothetical protein
MKKIVLLMVFALVGVLSASASTANDIATIRKFYTEYEKAYNYEVSLLPNNATSEYSRAVIKKYCTSTFLKMMDDDEQGYDFVTDDYGLDDLSLKTLNVVSTKKGYLVTFKVHAEVDGSNSIITVKLNVKMLKGKINSIEPNK